VGGTAVTPTPVATRPPVVTPPPVVVPTPPRTGARSDDDRETRSSGSRRGRSSSRSDD
jgi:hypothetical protein